MTWNCRPNIWRKFGSFAEFVRVLQAFAWIQVSCHDRGYLAAKLKSVNVEKYEDKRIEVTLKTFTPQEIAEADILELDPPVRQIEGHQ